MRCTRAVNPRPPSPPAAADPASTAAMHWAHTKPQERGSPGPLLLPIQNGMAHPTLNTVVKRARPRPVTCAHLRQLSCCSRRSWGVPEGRWPGALPSQLRGAPPPAAARTPPGCAMCSCSQQPTDAGTSTPATPASRSLLTPHLRRKDSHGCWAAGTADSPAAARARARGRARGHYAAWSGGCSTAPRRCSSAGGRPSRRR